MGAHFLYPLGGDLAQKVGKNAVRPNKRGKMFVGYWHIH